MIIVLDTNVLLADLTLKSEKTNLLLDYSRRTETPIYLPDTVLKELTAHVERSMERHLATLKSAVGMVETCTGRSFDLSSIPAPSKLVEEYMQKVRTRYRLRDDRIIRARAELLSELVDRAVMRRKPFDERGQQFRDALIWLSIMDMGDKTKAPREICFISMNTSDFALSGNLHPELQAEAKSRNILLDYYPSLDSFLKAHAERIAFITRDFVSTLIDPREIERAALSILNETNSRNYEKLKRYFSQHHRDVEVAGQVELATLSLELDDYYVYPGPNENEYAVIAVYEGEGELWGEVYQWEQPWQKRPFESDIGREWAHPWVSIEVEIKLLGDKLTSWNVSGCSI